MLFDTHAHFFTDDVARFPVDLAGAREGEQALARRLREDPATAQHILALWDGASVTGGAAVQYNTVYKTDNRYTLHVADEHHHRVSAVLILDAAAPETPEMLRHLSTVHNVSGLRLFGYPDDHGDYPWLDSAAALETWQVAAERGLTMVVMYGPARPSDAALGRVRALAERFPDTVITLDHCGWPELKGGVDAAIGPEHRALADARNITFKFTQITLNQLAGANIDAALFVRNMVDSFGADRLMWGSDYGNTLGIAYAEMVAQAIAATAQLDDAERAAVLHANGARLFGDRLP